MEDRMERGKDQRKDRQTEEKRTLRYPHRDIPSSQKRVRHGIRNFGRDLLRFSDHGLGAQWVVQNSALFCWKGKDFCSEKRQGKNLCQNQAAAECQRISGVLLCEQIHEKSQGENSTGKSPYETGNQQAEKFRTMLCRRAPVQDA